MKKLYLLLTFFVLLIGSQKTWSQCTCSGGIVPDSLVYNQYYDSIISTNTNIPFPQFNNAMGVLTCLRLSDTVTTVVNYNLENNLDTTEDYNFETYRRSQFTGPSGFFSSVLSPPKDYGPFTLGPYDPINHGDEVDVGPDTVFNKNHYTKYASPSPAYYGNGTVNFTYLTTSTFTILTGSDNAIIKLRAYTRLNVQLVYYWCPFSALETHLTGFTTSLKNGSVVVQWSVNDPRPTDKYEIEMSTDGKNFTNLGEGISSVTGDVENFKFLYNPTQNSAGNLLFRIKQTDYEGKFLFSEIRSVYINNSAAATYSLYPNPTVSGINIQFAKSTGGDYEVELFNSVGQSNFKKSYSVNQGASVNIEWTHKPAPGIYYLKVRDLKDRTQQVERLQIL
ncbi:MAG: T9SS type A sorting domain-containing protein [Ginsengibacter sp.]